MPIQEVVSEPDDGISLGCKRGYRGRTFGMGNVSQNDGELIVYALFNKSERKFRKRKPHRRRRRVTSNEDSEQSCVGI